MMQEYAEALLQRKLAMEKLAAIVREIAAAWTELRAEMAEGCAAARILRMQAYCTSLEVRRSDANVVLQAAERAVNQAMQRMLARVSNGKWWTSSTPANARATNAKCNGWNKRNSTNWRCAVSRWLPRAARPVTR